MGETSKFRYFISSLIKSLYNDKKQLELIKILDVGCGGDPLYEWCDKFDLLFPYTTDCVKNLTYTGDAKQLDEFVPNKYDILYSSHLLEDFAENQTVDVLTKWAKLINDKGYLFLLLPDQQRYVEHCKRKREQPNIHHQIPHFGLDYVIDCITQVKGLVPIYNKTFFEDGDYNFIVIAMKLD